MGIKYLRARKTKKKRTSKWPKSLKRRMARNYLLKEKITLKNPKRKKFSSPCLTLTKSPSKMDLKVLTKKLLKRRRRLRNRKKPSPRQSLWKLTGPTYRTKLRSSTKVTKDRRTLSKTKIRTRVEVNARPKRLSRKETSVEIIDFI
jgi:hypothetical protein